MLALVLVLLQKALMSQNQTIFSNFSFPPPPPSSAGKGFWSEMLGVGDFYYELGVQIIEVCLALKHRNGGQLLGGVLVIVFDSLTVQVYLNLSFTPDSLVNFHPHRQQQI